MSIATEIARLQTAKADIETAIEAKGVTVPANTSLSDFDTYIGQIEGGGGGGEWTPHPDWIDISSVNDNEINLLVGDGGVGIAFEVTVASSGTYSIDWGDGTVQTGRASASTQQHIYTIGSGQSVNNGQYTVFKIRIYGATGNITRFRVMPVSGYSRPQYHDYRWVVFGTTAITDYANAFYNSSAPVVFCRALESAVIPNFVSCLSTSTMFYNCYALSSVTLPASWGSVMNVSNMFYNCYALSSVTLPASWGSITSVTSMFQTCYALSSVTLPTSWGSVTNASYMFQTCNALSSVTLPTSWGSITGVTSMFQNCYALKTLNNLQFLGHQTVASDFTDVLRDAQALTGTLTIASKLAKIGIYGASGQLLLCTGIRLTNGANTWVGTSPQVNVSYTSLDATALDTLFGDLETIAGKTINITGCPGAATCNRTIATAKGWTVTG